MRSVLLGNRRWLIATAFALMLPNAGCTLVQPGCRNRDVKSSIEQDARKSIELWMSDSGAKVLPHSASIRLADQVEVARQDATRSCTANVIVGDDNDSVAVPIEYEVIAGDNGQPLYKWDDDEFGKQAFETAAASILMKMVRPQITPNEPDDPPAQQPSAPPATDTATWQKDVYAAIFARANTLTGMPSGDQTMMFRIGINGEVTMAKPVEPIENTELADRLVKFLDSTGAVAKPPSTTSVWVKVPFQFRTHGGR